MPPLHFFRAREDSDNRRRRMHGPGQGEMLRNLCLLGNKAKDWFSTLMMPPYRAYPLAHSSQQILNTRPGVTVEIGDLPLFSLPEAKLASDVIPKTALLV